MLHVKTISSLAAALALSVNGAAHAFQNMDLRYNIDFTTWMQLGAATAHSLPIPGWGTDSYLVLTHNGTGEEAGAAYMPNPVLIDFNQAFRFDFFFFIAHGDVVQGDGFTFFMTGTPGLGNGGSDLGYGGSGMDGYAVAVDTFNFSDEPKAVSVQILGASDVTPLAYSETGLADVQDPDYFMWEGWVEYTPSGSEDQTGNLSFSIYQYYTNDTFSVSHDVDWSYIGVDVFDSDHNFLGKRIYIGFTAGSGLADDGHYIYARTPIPEPGTWAMLLAGLGLVGVVVRRRTTA